MASPIAVPVSTSASVLWSGRNTAGINTLLLINTDTTNTVLVGSSLQSIVVPIPPNGSLSVDPVENWYVQGLVAGVAPLVVVPNGQSTFRGISQGQGKLALPAFQSPNYVTTVSGWAIFQNGHAEFNDILIRGGITVGGSEFLYSTPSPAPNTLLYSNSNTSTTDSAGNWYLPGTVNYGPDVFAGTGYLAVQEFEGQVNYWSAATMLGVTTPWVSRASVFWEALTGLTVQAAGAHQVTVNGSPLVLESATVVQVSPVLEMLAQSSTPPSIAGNPVLFGNANGQLVVIDGTDLQNYSTQRRSLVLAAATGSLVALTNVFTSPVGARTYRFKCRLFIDVAVVGAQLSSQLVLPAGATGTYGIEVRRAGVWTGGLAGPVNAVNTIAVGLGAATGYIADAEGSFTVTGPGTLQFQLGSATAQAVVIEAFSSIDIMPI